MKRLDYYWYKGGLPSTLLLPLSWLFCALAALRRSCYRRGVCKSEPMPVPVVVVGNLTAGGSGKTPLVVWLAEFLRSAGFRPGIVSRGYGGEAAQWPCPVRDDSDPREVGDEPVLIVRRTGCPMWVGPDRVAAARQLLDSADVNVIISDDGLQHYRLARDVEIAVVDGQRGFGNGRCLPAGPLRESPRRLRSVDFVVTNGGTPRGGGYAMRLEAKALVNLAEPGKTLPLSAFAGETVHAVAGIGHPERFFDSLRQAGLAITRHPHGDHHRFRPDDIRFEDDRPVIMTEKDAVKCAGFAGSRHWYLEIGAFLDEDFGERLLEKLQR